MDPATVFIVAVLIISIIIHEVAHGYMANWLGDPTARLSGRLTLNPISHIDPVGSILVPLVLFFTGSPMLFGWAKPVPYNPYNLRNQKWGEALVAVAGPGVNIIIALGFSVVLRVAALYGFSSAFFDIVQYIVSINVLLACFNLLPIPPLDGSKILSALLPFRAEMKYKELISTVEQYGFLASFVFIFVFMYLLWTPFSIVVSSIVHLLTGVN